ncbi:2,3-butanediol dehydrogenase [Ilyobacter polytropus]|uniref:Alcohol dehydrogenase GroES domain protein n=1 Tax=Ilyobacter polytropus (strain ATCC 51220 / DSM 2926 / LMG 16218 / CuHBu1) TaxID=572544 RepID=E3HC69_ILYPC|nr:2,3-butanediol dehydrogenase [Ilyobacter polytropus]ADO83912.1 Alcohol dehydrogenase GroES domain protein [Ilyobacter polytropus DSM 2926]
MKAALWYGPKDVRIEEVAEPVVKENEVKVKVKWCGICGTDLHEYLTGPIFIPVDVKHPATGAKAPVILGHEFSGEVVELGKNVTEFKIGDPVVIEPLVTCGECKACREGNYHLCDGLAFHGLMDLGGGLAEYTTFRKEFVKKLPEGVSYEKGALVEPLSVALHAIEVSELKVNQTAVVVGAGPIGLALIENLKALGAKNVIAVELSTKRKEFALKAGADLVLDPREVNVAEEVKNLTNGLGADISFEVTGVQAGFETSVDVIRKKGTVVVVSIWEKGVNFNLNNLVMGEKKIIGSVVYGEGIFVTTIKYLADGRIKADQLITKKIHLDDLVKEGFTALTGSDRDSQVKIIVTPDKSLID